MKYSIKVNEVKAKGEQDSSLKGFATVVFGDSFKITNIAILENREKGELFVSMPRYKSNEKDANGGSVYKDVCNPITAEFRGELYTNILEEYNKVVANENRDMEEDKGIIAAPEFSVTVTPFTRENSNIRGLARIYFEDSFIVNNVNLLQGKEKVFIAMPSYKTKQVDEQGRAIYQDVCYPVTKEFREKLYDALMDCYQQERDKAMNQGMEQATSQSMERAEMRQQDRNLPFR
ncbi:MAG: SpoVG family protein [Lachnospira sp.]|nr:SpoVG family protein [Lachnospira sp.]